MANAYKVLGQVAPSANTATTLYTVPASTEAVCSTLVICNRGISTTVRVAVRPAGATLSDEHYIIYETPINGHESLFFTLGISLAATDVITVQSYLNNVSFSLFGSEITA